MISVEHDRSSAQGATAVDSANDLALMARNGFSTQRPGKVAQLKSKGNDSVFDGWPGDGYSAQRGKGR